MSIFHLNVKHGSRKDGRLGVDKHDYILRQGRFAKRHDGELGWSLSGNMPGWAVEDPRKFWEAADKFERANGNIYHEAEFALPIELNPMQQRAAAREFAAEICSNKHPFEMGFHDKKNNPHVHLEWSGRQLDGIERGPDQFFKRHNPNNPERGGAAKASTSGDDWLLDIRRRWQEIANRHLAAAGHDARIDCRSHAARGLDEAPGVHLGRRATRLEQRGKSTWRGLKNREAAHLNATLHEIRSKLKEQQHEQQHPGRNGKPHPKPHHQRRDGAHAAPERAFTAWRDRSEDRQGLRASRRAGPERMPTLHESRAGDGLQEARNAVLQRPLSGSGSGDHGVHGLRVGGIYCAESLNQRQQYKRQLLTEHYNAKISNELADRLLYIDRQSDQTIITLRSYAGTAGGRVIDKGDRLTVGRRGTDAEILALIDLAKAKGWNQQIHITGTESFKARTYIEATRAGLNVVGYEPSPELRAQLQKEKTMLSQAGAGGMMALTPDFDVTAGPALPAARWLNPLRAAREKLESEHRVTKERLATLRETDLKQLGKELAAAHGGEEYQEALRDFKAAADTANNTGTLGRKRAEAKKEKAWQAFLAAHTKALAVPAAAQHLAEATSQNQEHGRLQGRIIPLALGIGEIQMWEREIKNGRDPEAEFLQAWQRRKSQPLKLWQEYSLAPIFEADAARERARLQAESDATDHAKQAQRQEQIKREIVAQQQVDAILDQLGQPGLTNDQQETLEQQQRYFQALADGHDEEEAKERAAKKSDAPRLH